MKLKGTLIEVKSRIYRIYASGDVVKRLVLEVHGESFSALHALQQKPLDIELTEERDMGPVGSD